MLKLLCAIVFPFQHKLSKGVLRGLETCQYGLSILLRDLLKTLGSKFYPFRVDPFS